MGPDRRRRRGVGMRADEVERVFERFYRGEATAAAPGTGLGLSIVKSLVDLHEWRDRASTSQPGGGRRSASGSRPRADAPDVRSRRSGAAACSWSTTSREIAGLIAGQLARARCRVRRSRRRRARRSTRLREDHFDAVTLDI